MSRYFAQHVPVKLQEPDWWDAPALITSMTVSDHNAIDTGLVDHRGDPIMRAPYPIGFGRDGEW